MANIDAKAFGPAALKVASATPSVVRTLNDPSSTGLGRLFTNPSSLNATDASSLGSAATGIASGFVDDPAAKVALATASYGLGAVANPFMAAWGAPAFVGSIHSILDGPTTEIRRARRTKDAHGLANEILEPVFDNPQGLASVFPTPVGGSTIGDTFSAMTRGNLSGTRFGNAHYRLPDPELGGLRDTLHAMGYAGLNEPTRGDVGGVGEIEAATGESLLPRSIRDFLWDLVYPPGRGTEGTGPERVYPEGGDYFGLREEMAGPVQRGDDIVAGVGARYAPSNAQINGLGWNALLRTLGNTPTTDMPPFATTGGAIETDRLVHDTATGASRMEAIPEVADYFARLDAFDPALGADIRTQNAHALDAERLRREAYANAP